jgi:tetratricopeptide (TPR) repeat protein
MWRWRIVSGGAECVKRLGRSLALPTAARAGLIVERYKDIPEEDRKKAQTFFERGKQVAATGNYDYAIEMFIQGLNLDPENVDAHMDLREISLKRKASGGKPVGIMERMRGKYTTSNADDKLNLLNAEKLLAFEPGNTDYMQTVLKSAHRAGCFDTVMWIGPIFVKANADQKKPEFDKYIVAKDVYKDMASDTSTPPRVRPELWRRATQAAGLATEIRPDDMELQREMKNLAALGTMDEGGYSEGVSFRESIFDRETQEGLLAQDKDHRDASQMQRLINEAEAQYRADPGEPGKLLKLVDALEKTEDPDYENRAIELLTEWFERSKQFRFRKRIGEINMKQWSRMERSQRQYIDENPGDPQAKADFEQFKNDKLEFELSEYQLWAENYPTDMGFRYEAAQRLFHLKKFDEAIPRFQEAQRDAKFRNKATLKLGQAFYELKFLDEAIDTLSGLIREYKLTGDDLSKEMYYWNGRAHEERGDNDAALKLYSAIVRMEFNYRDVQGRIRKLRSPK